MPTFLSTFAGIGGIDLGLERAGWTCVGQIEQNPYCQTVLKRHWPGVPLWGDITTVASGDLPHADLICGGFLCQPVSLAGKGLAQKDPRWLWPHFARLIRDLRPRFVLVENTPGLFARDRGFAEVLGDLAECGYDAEWECLPAAAFGAPHLRYRAWLVAYPNGWRRQGVGIEESGRLEGPHGRLADGCGPVRQQHDATEEPDGIFARREFAHAAAAAAEWWAAEPALDRMVAGFPGRVERIHALGNSVVPAIPEYIGRRILALDR